MEKYSQDNETLLLNLRNEEAQLMNEVSAIMSSPIKTAAQQNKLEETETRLKLVRDKITDLDLGKKDDNN